MNIASTIVEAALGNRIARRCVDAGFRWYAHRRSRQTDRLSVEDVQRGTLLRLVRAARDTRFGRAHGFASIRSIADYQARVALRDYEAHWQDYWQKCYPQTHGATWPEQVPYYALSSGTTSGVTKYIPVSRAMLASNQKAALTSLAWFRAAHPDVPLFNGRLFFLGGSTDLRPAGPDSFAGDLSGIATREAPALTAPFTFPPRDLALLSDWEKKLTRLAEQSLTQPITMISGVPSWLLVLFERLRQITGKDCIADIWPMLRLVIHGGTSFAPYRNLFRQMIGRDDVHFLETYPASEGFIAAEDHRFGMLRLIPDHNVFFEFVPVAELDHAQPTRHTVAQVVPGVQYAVVLTTCAGFWSYVLGDTVCFECADPPLLRFTGRTKYYLSAFGEHLINEEIERAIAQAASATGAAVTDFHVGPVFPEPRTERTRGVSGPGWHRYLVEFARQPSDLNTFVHRLDQSLGQSNEDYAAHRAGDLTMLRPEVCHVERGGFAAWMKSRGKLGGQHKLPRMDNGGQLTAEIFEWLVTRGLIMNPSNREGCRVKESPPFDRSLLEARTP
jgi:hypothetical protein